MTTSPGADDRWRRWKEARPEPAGLHLDSAAAGRSSRAVLAAVSDHALLEARVGAYVAQDMAGASLAAATSALAELLGMPREGVGFVESATAAFTTLLALWPFPEGASIGVLTSEWGPNLAACTRRGLRLVELPADGDGHADLAGVERLVRTGPPSALHLTQVASHRPLVQPVREIAALCRAAGVPLFVDAAQALGHVDTRTGADVVYATSRKWLAGPRGVGVLAVAERWHEPLRAVLAPPVSVHGGEQFGALVGSRESHVAGRIGLGRAAHEHLDVGPSDVWARLAERGRTVRRVLGDLVNWRVLGPADEPSAITALVPSAGQDVVAVRGRLLVEHGIVTTAQEPFRAPRDMTAPTLRVSPHVDTTDGELAHLRAALASL